jgi:putative tryptophan/tyrosine transport system substrate-binding protein
MKRRAAIVVIALLAATAGGAMAQPGKVPRIGVLHAGSSKESSTIQREPFERGLREHGWAPGSNVLIDYKYAEGNTARLDELAAALVRSGVDVIVTRAPAAITAARRATSTIPIVMSAGTDDPVAQGLAKSLSQPGGNVTGILTLIWELDKKRLELLKEAFPGISRVAVLANPNFDTSRYGKHVAALHESGRSLNLQLQIFEVRRADEIAKAFEAISRGPFQALLVQGDPQVLDHNRSEVVAMAAKHRLPAVYPWHFFAEAGGLMSYGTSFPAFHHRSATYVSRILRGANAGELPIEQPSKFELIVNVGAARAQGLAIPQSVLFRADHLIP